MANERMATHPVQNVAVPKFDPAEAKKLAEREARAKVRDEARKVLREHAAKLNPGDPIKSAIFTVIGTGVRRAGVSRASQIDSIRDFFIAKKTATEMDIFKEFKLGRPEMRGKMKQLVIPKNPKDRVWVQFNEDDGTYKVVATGEKMPANWEGFIPPDEADL